MRTFWSTARIIVGMAVIVQASVSGCDLSPKRSNRAEVSAEEYVTTLIRALGDQECTVRRAAAQALGRLGPHAKRALPVLHCATYDPSECVRRAAEIAMCQIEAAIENDQR